MIGENLAVSNGACSPWARHAFWLRTKRRWAAHWVQQRDGDKRSMDTSRSNRAVNADTAECRVTFDGDLENTVPSRPEWGADVYWSRRNRSAARSDFPFQLDGGWVVLNEGAPLCSHQLDAREPRAGALSLLSLLGGAITLRHSKARLCPIRSSLHGLDATVYVGGFIIVSWLGSGTNTGTILGDVIVSGGGAI
jgi:hypothetical protein